MDCSWVDLCQAVALQNFESHSEVIGSEFIQDGITSSQLNTAQLNRFASPGEKFSGRKTGINQPLFQGFTEFISNLEHPVHEFVIYSFYFAQNDISFLDF